MSRLPVTVLARCGDGQVIALDEESGRLFMGLPDSMSELDFGGTALTTMNNETTYFTESGDFFVDRSSYQLNAATWKGRSLTLLTAEDFDLVEAGSGVFTLTPKAGDYSI